MPRFAYPICTSRDERAVSAISHSRARTLQWLYVREVFFGNGRACAAAQTPPRQTKVFWRSYEREYREDPLRDRRGDRGGKGRHEAGAFRAQNEISRQDGGDLCPFQRDARRSRRRAPRHGKTCERGAHMGGGTVLRDGGAAQTKGAGSAIQERTRRRHHARAFCRNGNAAPRQHCEKRDHRVLCGARVRDLRRTRDRKGLL